MNKIFRAYIFLLLVLVTSCTSTGSQNPTNRSDQPRMSDNTGVKPTAETDTIYGTDSVDYESFKALFPDLVLGKHHPTAERLAYHPFIKEYFEPIEPEYIEAGARLEAYAVGKIIGYKGMDLYVVDDVDIRPDEDSYDNHVDNYRFVMIFKNGRPLKNKEGNDLRYALGSHYHGEGGESEYSCYFDKDTAVVASEYSAESESATGYSTPIVSRKEYRWRINEDGKKEFLEIARMEFSSDFYLQSFIDENDQRWKNGDWGRYYPTKDDRFPMSIDYFFASDKKIDLMNTPLYVYFYYDDADEDDIKVIFESCTDDNEVLDTYTLGSKKKTDVGEIDYTRRNKILKCPVIIKTSDGDVEILPDGRFRLRE